MNGLDVDGMNLAGTRFAGRGQLRDSVRSTNDTLQDLARAGAVEGTFVLAIEQTGGRGRRGRRWISQAGLGLYLSVLLRPKNAAANRWTFAAAVAACDACRRLGASATTIQWPNDLLVGERKLAGILVDVRTAGAAIRDVVIGLGVNVHHDADQLRLLGLPGVTSLRREAPSGILGGRTELAGEFLRRLEPLAAALEAGEWDALQAAWLERAPTTIGARVVVTQDAGDTWSGVTAGLGPDGALRVGDDGGCVHAIRQVDSVRFMENE